MEKLKGDYITRGLQFYRQNRGSDIFNLQSCGNILEMDSYGNDLSPDIRTRFSPH